MSTTETELHNYITSSSWAEGAATPERLGSFLNRRMAAIAVASEVELHDSADDDFELWAA